MPLLLVMVRVLYVNEFVGCSLVMGKSRVAPLKPISVPRLELTAAVVAAKLGSVICRELEYDLNNVVYWTDATVVLRYLHNTHTRFRTFVANRLEILHTLTSVTQWRYVPTEQNPADIASRGLLPHKAAGADLWLYGPPYLREPLNSWPDQPEFLKELEEDDSELRKSVQLCTIQKIHPTENALYYLLRRYSSFFALQRAVAWILRYKQFLRWKAAPCRDKPNQGLLTVEEMAKAALAIVRVVQRERFFDVLKALPNHVGFDAPFFPLAENQMKKSAGLKALLSLAPFVVDGVLRVGGRLQRAPIYDTAKHPILLPSKHPITKLIILQHHVKKGHMGVSQTLSSINKNY